ncbi:MAG: glycosyltransferase [Gemmataceae bacterium]|nr:glycosyltransferase [Gemmataceae bacterium]
MDVTVCLLTRNHAASVGRAVASARPLAGRVLLADTGSTDDTVALARAAGADILVTPWSDDFGAACNAVLDRVETPWVLWLNPDEELESFDGWTAALGDESAFAYRLTVRQKLRPDDDGAGTSGFEERLFRRVPEVRYSGRVHPQFTTPLGRLAAEFGQQVKTLPTTIVRHAYLSTPTPDKLRWVVRLLEAELRDRPDRLAVKIELGRNLLWLNDPRGHAVLAEAAQAVVPFLEQPAAPDPAVGQLFEYLLNADPSKVNTSLPLDRVRALVPVWFARTPPVLWAAAQERYRAGDFTKAIAHLDALLEIGRTGWYDSPGFDPDIIGVSAGMALGACHVQQQNWLLARACFEHYRNHPKHGELARRGFAEADAKWRAELAQRKS